MDPSGDDLSVGDVFTPQTDTFPHGDTNERSGNTENADHSGVEAPSAKPDRRPEPAINAPALAERVGRRKKKKRQQMPGAPPALSTVRGFVPAVSGDEDSDVSSTSSRAPSLRRPVNGNGQQTSNPGVSALALQLDSMNIDDRQCANGRSGSPSNGSVYSDSDQTEVLTSYEVPLEHDYVSADAVAEKSPDDMRTQLCRKMTSDDFEPMLCLGKGSFGTVLLVRHVPTGKLYAQKQFRKASITVHKKLVEQTKTERTILESVNRHPFVVKLFYAFQDHEKLYLILEYAEGGELFTHLAMERMFDEDVAAFYMAEMVLALEHLHQNVGVIYRDLKPENCLLDKDGHLLLTDFGLSKISADDEARCDSSKGTYEYMAPEVIRGTPYGKACDWWSLGALGYDLLTGSPPFQANNHAKIQEKIVKQKLSLPYFLGPDAKDLLTRLLRKDPSKRLGYHMPKDLQTIKKHRFFRKIDWKALEARRLPAPITPVVTDPAAAENFSQDFTHLPLSPLVTSASASCGVDGLRAGVGMSGIEADPFGGFSFVAPSSLFEYGVSPLTGH